jgi:hypothetical protein
VEDEASDTTGDLMSPRPVSQPPPFKKLVKTIFAQQSYQNIEELRDCQN